MKLIKFLDVLFPLACVACHANLADDALGPACARCLNSVLIFKRFNEVKPDIYLAAIGLYEDAVLRSIIQAFKYRKILTLEKSFTELIRKYLTNINISMIVDAANSVIIPVPLYPRKERKRGFNQALAISRIVSRDSKIPVAADILKRVKDTLPQIEMKNDSERRKNVRESFAVNPEKAGALKNKDVILVDDVYTSGATTEEAIRTLRKAGAKRILIFVVARA